ncbi:MAG: acetylornithine/N-succinyldiaminopimelate aminotransferase [Saprospiraceae bacterium]|jgi:acetylornithine/N-succinyldiaminopimelate aminotransferase
MSEKNLFLQHVGQTSPFPTMLEIKEAKGIYLYDKSGKRYIDAISGICVSALGHSHERIVKAIQEQAAIYLHPMVYGEFVLSPQVQYAKLLADNLPEKLNCVFYTNSGSEAVEGAMKLAKRYTGRHEIIACRGAYHGSTHGAMSLMSEMKYKTGYYPLMPGIRFIDFNNIADLEKITTNTACVFTEPIQAAPGVRKGEKAFLKALRKRCDETGTLLIFDEIQVGFGRTGTLFAFEQYEVIPDVLLLAKALGGTLPLGALVADRDVLKVLSNNPILGFISTFGGHPLSCVAGHTMLETILAEKLIGQVEAKSQQLQAWFQHPRIKAVRAAGLLIAVDFGEEAFALKVLDLCYEMGFITDFFLFNERSIRIAPPLNITAAEIDELGALLISVINRADRI